MIDLQLAIPKKSDLTEKKYLFLKLNALVALFPQTAMRERKPFMRHQISVAIVFFLAFVAAHPGFAQNSDANTQQQEYLSESIQPHQFDESTWNASIEDLDYTIKRKPPPKPTSKRKAKSFNWPALGSGVAAVLKFFVILLAATILGLIIRHYLNAPRNIAVKKLTLENLSIEDIEANLEETELLPFIRQAIDQSNFSLAVRLYYLEILKQLSGDRAIVWRKNKTNRQYLQEMATSPRLVEFRMLTLIFERIRYGGQALTRPQFEEIEPGFTAFLNNRKPSISVTPSDKVAL